MDIVVQKFGGTSVRDAEGREHAYEHIKDALKNGQKVVAVVSAMGRKGDPYATDTLLSLVEGGMDTISKREQDMLLSCGEIISAVVFTSMLNGKGLKATALTGAQAGFLTTNEHTNARIIAMKCDRLIRLMETYDVVVVAGFQGADSNGDVTTIGRGGSDTSAAALGAALNAKYIDIFTDVEGVMTADPRIVKDAKPLSYVTYTEICNLAYQGAKVIHPRAVEIAMQAKIPIRIRSTYAKSTGTLIASEHDQRFHAVYKERIITGIAHVQDITQIKVEAKEGNLGFHSEIFKSMAVSGISVDFFNITPKSVVYTVFGELTDEAVRILKGNGYDPIITRHCAKISAVGGGIQGVPGIAAKIVSALSAEGIQILQSADSHTTIWVLVNEEDMTKAVNALHRAFELGE